jgi:hypothetical protein
MADIDMSVYSGTDYNIIGNSQTAFSGHFDGNGFVIRNLTYSTKDAVDYAGLFGFTGTAYIQNVRLEDVSIYTEGSYVGALIGHQWEGNVIRCSSTGSVTAAGSTTVFVGGLVGAMDFGANVIDCSSSCTVTASADTGGVYAGGLVGKQNDGIICRSYTTGSVSASGSTYSTAGGIAGAVEWGGEVLFCSAAGAISAASDGDQAAAGGIAGHVEDGSLTDNYSTASVTSVSTADISIAGGLVARKGWGNIERCYSTGTVTANGAIESIAGGLAGIGEGFVGCFWDTDTSNQSTSAGGEDVVGLSTIDMQTLATFTDGGWDFADETTNGTNDIWRMCADGVDYPKLNWESIDGDFACPAGVDSDDLDYFFQRWLFTDCTADNNFCGGTDMNTTGNVDMADFAIFAQHWLEGI